MNLGALIFGISISNSSARVNNEWLREQGPSQTRAVGRLTKILKLTFDIKNFEYYLTNWEDEIYKYEKETNIALTYSIGSQ